MAPSPSHGTHPQWLCQPSHPAATSGSQLQQPIPHPREAYLPKVPSSLRAAGRHTDRAAYPGSLPSLVIQRHHSLSPPLNNIVSSTPCSTYCRRVRFCICICIAAAMAPPGLRSILVGAVAALPALAMGFLNASYSPSEMMQAEAALLDIRPDGCPPWYARRLWHPPRAS